MYERTCLQMPLKEGLAAGPPGVPRAAALEGQPELQQRVTEQETEEPGLRPQEAESKVELEGRMYTRRTYGIDSSGRDGQRGMSSLRCRPAKPSELWS